MSYISSKLQERIEKICAMTGWSDEKTKVELSRAREKGLKSFHYIKYKCWLMTDAEIQELVLKLERQEKSRAERQKRVNLICAETNWSEEKAILELERIKAMGLKVPTYMRNKGWNMSEEELLVLIEKQNKLEAIRQQRIAKVCVETGWDEQQVKSDMNRVQAMGFNQLEYMRNECWRLTDNEILSIIRRRDYLKNRTEALKNPIQFVCNEAGWEYEYAVSEMEKARKEGISFELFAYMEMFRLTWEEILCFAELLKKKETIANANKIFYIEIVAEKAGWSFEKAKTEIENAINHGVNAQQYARKSCWLKNAEEFEKIRKSYERENYSDAMAKELYMEKIMGETGWSRAKLELEFTRAENACGCIYKDYYAYKFYQLPEEEWQRYVTMGEFNKIRAKYNSYQEAISSFDDKANFNHIFADHIHRKWFKNRNLSYPEFLEIIQDLDYILLKPLNATQGVGLQKFNCRVSEFEKRNLYNYIMQQGESIVEEYIVQHESVMKYCPTSVNTIRITTLNANGKCNYLYSIFRMGCGALADNMHAGGVAAGVNVETGITETYSVDLDGHVKEFHPLSGLPTKGFIIPHWDKIIDTCEKIYNRVDGVNLIGWDFAITPDGVDLIEGNPGTSYIGAQVPYMQDKIGLRQVMVDPFL